MSATTAVFPYRKILACVAEGTHSDDALRAAAALAERANGELELLHVVPPLVPPTGHFAELSGPAIERGRADRARDALRAHIAHRHADVKLRGTPLGERLQVEVGSPARVVLERLRRGTHDLVVVGDSGKRKQLDFGGLARALFASAPCPIWMQVEPPRALQRILVPIDLSPASHIVLGHAVDLAASLGARITALNCFVSPELYYAAETGMPIGPLPYTLDALRKAEREAFERTVEEFAWRGVAHTAEFVEEDPARAILAAQERFDLIVLGTHGRSALAAAVLGSVTWQVLRLARTPVVTYRAAGAKYAL